MELKCRVHNKSREENVIPRSGWITLYVGKRAYAEAALAEYVDDDGETYTIGSAGASVSNPDDDSEDGSPVSYTHLTLPTILRG